MIVTPNGWAHPDLTDAGERELGNLIVLPRKLLR